MILRGGSKITKRLARSVLTVYIHYKVAKNYHLTSASGFPIVVGGQWWLVTARHVVELIAELKKANQLNRVMLGDAWVGLDGKGYQAQPPLEVDHPVEIGDDLNSIDLAAFKIRPLLVSSLKAGNTIAVAESNWRQVPKHFKNYYLLGFPGELMKKTPSSGAPTEIEAKRCLMRLKKIPTADGRFHASICDGPKSGIMVSKIEGVSGGPIFGAKRFNNGVRIWVIAVQSSWDKSKKKVTGDYLVNLGDKLLKMQS